jgi:hypothetical protein
LVQAPAVDWEQAQAAAQGVRVAPAVDWVRAQDSAREPGLAAASAAAQAREEGARAPV